jgi:hypothetical protein
MEAAENIIEDGVRDAILRDVPEIVRLGIEALKADPAPGQVIDSEKLQDVARFCVHQKNNYATVAVKHGEIVGALCAIVDDQPFYQRKVATVVQFYVDPEKGRGEGIKMIRRFRDWYKPQRKIKAAAFTLEHGADPRIAIMLKRLGFVADMPIYVDWM